MTDLNHIHPTFRDKVGLSAELRIEFLEDARWIGYPAANKAIQTMAEYMNRPSQSRNVGLLLTGKSNNGKTTIINRFKELYGEKYTDQDEEPVVPIIYCEAPSTPDEKGLYASILDQLWSPVKVTAPLIKLRYQTIHLMRLCQVKILIIDEIQSMLSGSAIKRQQVMNALKSLSNELKIPIVGVGIKSAFKIIQIDKQHASRFDIMRLPDWEVNVVFQRLLIDFEGTLPLKLKSNLKRPDKARLIHAFSNGNIGDLRRLLVECAKMAIVSGKERIDMEIIKSFKYRKISEIQKSIEVPLQ